MKAFTDIEQSKKLTEVLPLKSADMEYMFLKKDGSKVSNVPFVKDGFEEPECCYIFIPCWSLAALFSVLPSVIKRKGKRMFLTLEKAGAYNLYYKSSDRLDELWETNVEPVDTCVDMIVKLKEMNLL